MRIMHPCLSSPVSTHRSAAFPTPRRLTILTLSCLLALCAGGAGASTTAPAAAAAKPAAPAAEPAKPAAKPAAAATIPHCGPANTVSAHVVALDQQFWLNRLGASQPGGMIFALERDVVPSSGSGPLTAGNVKLRDSKRPRPLVLRANVGDCLDVHFTNLLNPTALSFPGQTATREAGVHVMGMPLRDSILSDGSFVGLNTSSLVSPLQGPATPNGQITYRLYAEAEGTFLLYSTADNYSGGLGGQLSAGLFGAVTIQPKGAEWYRSQVTRQDLELATKRGKDGKPLHTSDGQPLLDYAALYPAGAKWPDGTPIPPGTPILRMLDAKREIVASDLTALITGPHAGNFPADSPDPVFRKNAVEPNRTEPYREFTLLYHEIFTSVQAFPEFAQGTTSTSIGPTLGNGGDAFAINYGTGGIAAEILANRLGVGPAGRCVDCKFEEFFLSAWATGDPATVVDVPANNPCTTAQLEAGTACGNTGTRVPATGTPFQMEPVVQAHKAVYPDDPSNVYHSYLNDHVKMRVLHAGSFIAHVHHLHAHQWLHTPNSDESTYLDSQLITPGTSYTLEIAFGGSGNLNKTAGDSIFHCHFYPHFAGGMWALWRVHDTFEDGTLLDVQTGIPPKGARALPDGEIAAGTPIPAIVPIPTLPMAPEPAKVSIVPETVTFNGQSQLAGYKVEVDPGDLAKGKTPGYPFFVPGVAGHRAPHPPLDFAQDPASGKALDGGLPRHILLDGNIGNEHHNQWDFSKDTDVLLARELPEDGTPVEKAAMAFSSTKKPWVPSYTQANQKGFFEVNGLPSVPGAPFANPARNLNGDPVPATVRRYKGADLQTDVVFTKKGWHYPQERHITLWDDVAPTVAGTRPPEPLFLRANSKTDVIEYWMTNLVPGYYELDDFQVRTPTDILGQHIHLVKFDVLASDGAANGYNYEDGSLSPDEVRERISGIRKGNNCKPDDKNNGTFTCPVAQAAPAVFGKPPEGQDWTGAQTTIQRWYADPVLNNKGDDRTLRTVFTHDHFGPSTHQQAGLYAGLLVEPTASTWRAPAIVSFDKDGKRNVQTDVLLGTRDDGGPTSWQADILTKNPQDSYREFALEFQDTSLSYNAKSPSKAVPYPPGGNYPTTDGLITPTNKPWGWADCANAINPLNACPASGSTTSLAAWPGIITGGPGSGNSVTNYRSEPVPFRVAGGAAANSQPNADLSQAYRSIERQDAQLNRQPYGPIAPGSPFLYPGGFLGADDFDPYTPLLRTYQGDKVQVRILTGAHVAGHFFTLQGLRWLFEPSYEDSGYVSTQGTGLSEHFEPTFSAPHTAKTDTGFADYLYVTGAGQADQVQGMWGLIRAYDGSKPQEGLPMLPNNPQPGAVKPPPDCPAGAPVRKLDVTAVTAAKALASGSTLGQIAFNSRGATTGAAGSTPNTSETIQQPDGLLYVRTSDLNADGTLKKGVPVEPLVLRAAAGECLQVTLTNGLVTTQKDANGNPVFTTALSQAMGDVGDSVNLYPSWNVGLRAQLVSYDVTKNGAFNAGHNPVQTVEPGKSRTFTWYAGIHEAGKPARPAELGTSNLIPSDPLMQDPLGLIGALVVEPAGAKERTDANSRAAATITRPDGSSFREIVLFTQSDLQSIQGSPAAYLPNLSWSGVSSVCAKGDNTCNGISDRTEPLGYRTSQNDVSNVLSDSLPGVGADPQTPVFPAAAGKPVRFRLAQVSGTGDAENLTLHGHVWQEEPFQHGSTVLGDNPLSEWFGTSPHGPENNVNILLKHAGGPFHVPGDYLYRSFFAQTNFSGGEWGIFRVLPAGKDSVVVGTPGACPGNPSATCVSGTNTVNPATGKFAAKNTIYSGSGPGAKKLGDAAVDPATGAWSFQLTQAPPVISVQTAFGSSGTTGTTTATLEAAPRIVPPRPHTKAEDARERRALTFLRRRPVPPQAPQPEKGDH